MRKIPTIYVRGETGQITREPHPACDWVFNGEGVATEKLDGTNVRLTIRNGGVVRAEKRYNPRSHQKKQGIFDPWYIDVDPESPGDQWIRMAVAGTLTADWPDGEHSCEALGPKIQNNPLDIEGHHCVPFMFKAPIYAADVPATYEAMRDFVVGLDSLYRPGKTPEGIVFHHPDGRLAKIKRYDFLDPRLESKD